MLYLTLLFLSRPSLGRARRLAWIKRPRRTPSLNRVKHQILKRLFMKIYPMIHHSRMTFLLLKKGLLTPQALSTSPQAPSGLRNPPIHQSLLISQQPQCKPAMPRMMRFVITSIGRTEPGNPVALSRHTAKEEFAAIGKGKWNADLSTYAALNAQDLHSGYLNRLYTSRDYEAGLVNMMKQKYEVTWGLGELTD